jgi:hypothetical protein
VLAEGDRAGETVESQGTHGLDLAQRHGALRVPDVIGVPGWLGGVALAAKIGGYHREQGVVLGAAGHGPSGCPPVPASAAARDRRCPPSLSGSVWHVAPLPKAIPAAPLAATRSGWSKK